jgi:hypothetical protein
LAARRKKKARCKMFLHQQYVCVCVRVCVSVCVYIFMCVMCVRACVCVCVCLCACVSDICTICALNKGYSFFQQVIGIVTHVIEVKGDTGPFLIIAPLSTITNWALEFRKWAPTIEVSLSRARALPLSLFLSLCLSVSVSLSRWLAPSLSLSVQLCMALSVCVSLCVCVCL